MEAVGIDSEKIGQGPKESTDCGSRTTDTSEACVDGLQGL